MPWVASIYGLTLIVVYRTLDSGDAKRYRGALAVLAGNELWNLVFSGRRSTRAGLLGIVAFTVTLLRLQVSEADDRVATLALTPYTLWTVGHAVPWA